MSLEELRNNPIFAPLFTLEHQKRHQLEFQFIPNMIPVLYSSNIISDDVLTNPKTWEDHFGPFFQMDPKYLEQITVVKKELDNGVKKFLMTFPIPKVGTESFFAILYFDKEKKSKYFTLELELGNDFGSGEGTGLICGQEGKNHLNYGRICKANLNDFEKCVDEFYKENQNQ